MKGSKFEDPFKKNTSLTVTVKGGETKAMSAYLKSKFDSTYEKFKYTIQSDTRSLDPDLDVVEPPLEPDPKRKSPTSRR